MMEFVSKNLAPSVLMKKSREDSDVLSQTPYQPHLHLVLIF